MFCRSGAEAGWAELRGVLWALRWHAAVLALDFAATIAVFPSVTASICSVANPAVTPPCLPRVEGAGRLAGALAVHPEPWTLRWVPHDQNIGYSVLLPILQFKTLSPFG